VRVVNVDRDVDIIVADEACKMLLWCMQFSKAKDTDQLKAAIENYQGLLRNQANPKNLKKFVEAFLRFVTTYVS